MSFFLCVRPRRCRHSKRLINLTLTKCLFNLLPNCFTHSHSRVYFNWRKKRVAESVDKLGSIKRMGWKLNLNWCWLNKRRPFCDALINDTEIYTQWLMEIWWDVNKRGKNGQLFWTIRWARFMSLRSSHEREKKTGLRKYDYRFNFSW